jgi:hypothetical protein
LFEFKRVAADSHIACWFFDANLGLDVRRNDSEAFDDAGCDLAERDVGLSRRTLARKR